MGKIYTRFGIDIPCVGGGIVTKTYNLHEPEELYYKLIGLELQDFKSYLEDMKISVEKIKNEMLERDVGAFNYILSNNYEYAHRIDIRYPNLLNNSVFISIFSLLEDVLFRFFETCKYRLKIDVKLKEKKKEPILTKYLSGIEKALNYTIPYNFKRDFSNYRKVRNCITHKRGYVTWAGVTDENLLIAVNGLLDKGVSLSENKKGIILSEEA
ncbi:hypothetical protein [Lysinibacillus sphaericus]|uniref:hypothetical protein n=1 Tax=Lysinibacillus sphaericus TaxID=1421 RepID=UPI001CBFEAC3|nr:hypothetical protein [Lysinibacillus sphaericus]